MSNSLTFDPFDAAQTQHMWDLMREFRDRAPVARIGEGFVYVSRYADVETVLRDQETFSNGGGMRPTGVEIPLHDASIGERARIWAPRVATGAPQCVKDAFVRETKT